MLCIIDASAIKISWYTIEEKQKLFQTIFYKNWMESSLLIKYWQAELQAIQLFYVQNSEKCEN